MTTIDRGGAVLAELRAGFAGEVILPEDPSYEAARAAASPPTRAPSHVLEDSP